MSSIFKFRNWEDNNHKMIIRDNTIHFASPNSFNDPFDSTIPFRYDLINDNELMKAYCRVIKHDEPHISRQEMRKRARAEVKQGFARGENYLKGAAKITSDFNSRMFGIFSVAREYHHLLMWSHYAAHHKGFCIEFNYEVLVDFCTQYFFKKNKILESRSIIYQEEYPIMIPTIENDIEFMLRPLTIKSKAWEYENEYRLIVYEGAGENVVLPDGIIVGIILGCKMSEQSKNEIKEIAKAKNINIAESRMHFEKYALKYRNI
ncbi:MAG: DUF2971 domain-containing protein [Ignavibacteriota bacterium]